MIPFWLSLVVSVVATGAAIVILRRRQLLDVPNHRSSHAVPTPRGGGLAVMVAVVVGVAVSGNSESWPVLLPALLLAAVGFADDLRSLSSRVRLAAQVALGLLLSLWVAHDVGTAGLAAAVFVGVCLVGIVGYVNAFNFMDGVNGISALNAAVGGAWFAWLGHQHDSHTLLVLGAVVAGAALGFLPWNASSRVFLGDVGSYGLGALLAGAAVLAWAHEVPAVLCVAPLLVYFADTAWVIVRRARAGRPLTEAHREHVYQRLVQGGWSHLGAAAWCAGSSGALAVAMAVLYDHHRAAALALVVLVLSGYLATPRAVRGLRGTDVVTT